MGDAPPEHSEAITELTRADLDRAWVAIECLLYQAKKEASDEPEPRAAVVSLQGWRESQHDDRRS